MAVRVLWPFGWGQIRPPSGPVPYRPLHVDRHEILEGEEYGGFVSPGNPYTLSRPFRVFGSLYPHEPAYLLVWYSTGYPNVSPNEANENQARVLINNIDIGGLPPHPWQRPNGGGLPDHRVVALPFNAGLLRIFTRACALQPPNPFCSNTLVINAPPATVSNPWVYVGKIILHYTERWWIGDMLSEEEYSAPR